MGAPLRADRLRQISPDAADDYMTLQLLAAGLAGIQSRQSDAQWNAPDGRSSATGFPPAWKAGMNRLWWRALESGQRCVASHMDVLQWCRLPLEEWPIALDVRASDAELRLLEDGRPTAFADQAARLMLSRDPEAELVENRCFELLLTVADRNSRDEAAVQRAYVDLRGFLIQHPVVSDLLFQELLRRYRAKDGQGQPWLKQWFLHAYTPRPAVGRASLRVCDECANPLADGQSNCGTAGCSGAPKRQDFTTMSEYYVQRRGVRRFLHDPGLAEQRVLDALEPALGRRLHPWWGMDAVDAAVDFDGVGPMGTGEWWAADVKDHASATLLGRSFRWDERAKARRRLLVIAQHRFERAGYLDDLLREMDGRVKGVEVMSEEAFISAVLRRAGAEG